MDLIYRLYPGSGQERQWLIVDMEGLVEKRCHIEIKLLGNFGNYF
jgi:hypothetical protein